MASDVGLISLSSAELIALIQQLRRQLAERDQEIERLQRRLGETPAVTDESPQKAVASEEAGPGSTEDLLAQLEKIYPEGR
jgi:hypothetical protein